MKKSELKDMIRKELLNESINKDVKGITTLFDKVFEEFLDQMASEDLVVSDKLFEKYILLARKHLDAFSSILEKNIK